MNFSNDKKAYSIFSLIFACAGSFRYNRYGTRPDPE